MTTWSTTPPARPELELWESLVWARWPGGPQLMLARGLAEQVDLDTLTVRTDRDAWRTHLMCRCHLRHFGALRVGVARLAAAELLDEIGEHLHRITYPGSRT